MAQFSEMIIPFIIFIIGINTLFAATNTMPGGQFADSNTLFSDIITPDVNASIYTFVYTIDDSGNTIATTTDLNNQTVLSNTPPDLGAIAYSIGNFLTGGGLGYASAFMGFVTQMAFGYMTWLDYFFNPAWGPLPFLLGSFFKGTFLILQIYALLSIFIALVGRKI